MQHETTGTERVPPDIFRPVTEHRQRPPLEVGEVAIRELMAVREIAHAFLTAERPEDALEFALASVTPLVGATFASVFLIEEPGDLLRLAAAYNWPERFRPFLGDMRVRLGRGPSGTAAAARRAVCVRDVFASEDLADWQDVARELGFRALVALPLQTKRRVLGAITFYFADSSRFAEEEDELLRIVADQVAASAERAALIDELRRANTALTEANAELERQYSAAVESRRLKEEFLSNISHELRTPLTSVLGYIYLLQEGMSGPITSEQRHALKQVTSSSEHLLGLIEDLLELAALKRGDYRIILEEFDVGEVVRDAVAAAHAAPPAVELKVDLPGEPCVVRSDRGKVMKILVNLLANAYKFTAEGEVRVSVECDRGLVRLRVNDTGIGIPPEAHQLVFQEFRQLDGSPTRRYSGSGLGLSLARHLARLLGGDLVLVSQPGKGSEFTTELPLLYTPPGEGDKLHASTRDSTAAETK